MKYLYGASGHAKVILDIMLSNNEFVSGIFDDDLDKVNTLDVNFLGRYDASSKINKQDKLLISIGNNQIRKVVAQKIKHGFFSAIHKKSIVSASCNIGFGSVVMPQAIVNAQAIIGNHCIINTASVVEHDCIIKDFVHIAPNATLTGNVTIGEGTLIGAATVIIPGITIGKWCLVGAGSVITQDIPDYAVVVGNPGKIRRYNKNSLI